MKHKLGVLLIILGCGLIAAAIALFLRNQQEQLRAASASRDTIVKVVEAIQENKTASIATEPGDFPTMTVETSPTLPTDREMTVVDIDGYGYIGFLGIPSLNLELPVMADWSYPQLQIAPCRYYGSSFAENLVIVAHNYASHFGGLKDMKTGEEVTFTDMDGNTTHYQVVALEILPPDAVEDVISGDFALTLLTCTYGGENRVVLRCDRVRD